MRRLVLIIGMLLVCAPALGSTGAKTAQCFVPNVVGRKLAVAKETIASAGCRTARIKSAYSRYVPRSIVITQNPPGGFRLSDGGVNLVVSKGKPRKR